MKFIEFDIDDRIKEAVSYMGYETATPIQEKAIPVILSGKDLIACAQTGTGKTAAFLLPALSKILDSDGSYNKIVIITPTRELALQIDQQLQGLAYFLPISSIPVYGGGDGAVWEQQKKSIVEGADVIIATPGRLISHINLGYVDFKDLDFLILDEADKMLDMGFYDDIMKITKDMSPNRQTLMFSATMPPKFRELAKNILKDHEEISIAISKPAENILQAAYLVYDNQKIELIKSLLQEKELHSAIIFSSTKSNVKNINSALKSQGLNSAAIHSDLGQEEREEVLRNFKNKKLQILVATDILSRGIDIVGIDLVINYDVPSDSEDYVHRIGRTARAEASGVALTFITDSDQYNFAKIEKFLEKEIYKIQLPAEIGVGPEYNPRKQQHRKPRPKKVYSKPKRKLPRDTKGI